MWPLGNLQYTQALTNRRTSSSNTHGGPKSGANFFTVCNFGSIDQIGTDQSNFTDNINA